MDTSEARAGQAAATDTPVTPLGEKPAENPADVKKAEHEAAETKRKAEWDLKQAEKKTAEQRVLDELQAKTNEEVTALSINRIGADLEKATKRSMKICVSEHIQDVCRSNPDFARKALHPRKNMLNCFKYIYKKAREYIKNEMEMAGEKPTGEYGADVPDGLCYQWAEDYFNDPNAEVDQNNDDKFVPKTYYGGASSSQKKKDTPKKKEPAKPEPEQQPEQFSFAFGGE